MEEEVLHAMFKELTDCISLLCTKIEEQDAKIAQLEFRLENLDNATRDARLYNMRF